MRSFVEAAGERLGMRFSWKGTGIDEVGTDEVSGKALVRINPEFFRPAEVDILIGSPKKAETELGWRRKVGFNDLVGMMAEADDRRVATGHFRF